jgi:iron complex transport system substrate-binding protein
MLVAAVPARIVSTSPSITESLYALGLGDRIVGVSTYCRFPHEAARLPKVGTFLKPDTELIAQLRPDLVIVHAGPHDVPRQMSALGIRSISVDRGTLDAVYTTILAIGDEAGVPDRAAALVGRLRQHLNRIHTEVSRRPARKVLIVVGRQAGTLADLVVVGEGSYLHDLIAIGGGVNVMAGYGVSDYPHISLETVVRLSPDVVIDAGDMGNTPEEHVRRKSVTEQLWKRQKMVAAAQRNDIHAVTSDAFVVPGPRVIEVAETLAQWLHGVRVP